MRCSGISPQIVDDQLVAGLLEVGRHAGAHGAEPDKTDLHGCHPRPCRSYAQFRRARIALPITQSLSSSDRNFNSSVKCVMRCLYVALASELVRSVPQ